MGNGHGHLAIRSACADTLVCHAACCSGRIHGRIRRRVGCHGGVGRFSAQAAATRLLGVLVYTLAKKDLGRHHKPRHEGRAEVLIASLIGALIGFYDGFFGPGTGSFFVFLFVRLLGYDFLNASASAKLLNCATNIAAIALFAAKGHVWWHFAVTLAVANIVGSLLGTHMALKHGTGFVRGIFIVVVSTLILKTGYDAFLR
jgi:uncharacterized membrane protein YfcA